VELDAIYIEFFSQSKFVDVEYLGNLGVSI
jgi:hypothetical protein